MGTALSISPANKEAILDSDTVAGGAGVKKKHSLIVAAFPWKKLVPNSVKNGAKKVNPTNPPVTTKPNDPPTNGQVARLNKENSKKSLHNGEERKQAPVPAVPKQVLQPVPTQIVLSPSGKLCSVQKQPSSLCLVSPRRVIIQASTGELLRCLGNFVCRRCCRLKELTSGEVILWFRNIDRTLLLQGWQDQGFITPSNLVFVYLLCQDTLTEDMDSAHELQGTFLVCLYLAYSYMGNEISYPYNPFMIISNREVFWDMSLAIINKMSAKMLILNSDPHFFTEVFQELKDQGDVDASVDR